MQTKLFSSIGQLLFGSRLNGIASNFTSRSSRSDSLSIVSRQSVLATYVGRIVTIFALIFTLGVGNAWGISTSDLSTSAATSLTDGATYVVATSYDGTYLTTSVSSGWGGTTTSIGDAAIFTAHGSASAFYLTCSEGRLVPASSKTFYAYDEGTSNNLSLSAGGDIQNSSSTDWTLRLNGSFRWYSTETGSAVYLFMINSCGGTKLGTPVVTATPTSGKVTLTWPAVSNASGYQLNWNGGGWASASSGIEKSGLTDGTTYTYQVKAIGDGDDYCDGDASASASVVPGTYYTVTWNAAGSSPQTTSVRSGTKPTFPSTPSSCDATSTTFYGWATTTWSGTLDDVSAKTIYTSASDMPTVSGSGVNYYAVFAKKSASGDYVKGTKSDLTDGQTVMIVNYYYDYAMSSDDDATYDFYRDAIFVDISDNTISSPDGALIWTVEEGENGGYYFKHGDNYINVGYSSQNDDYYLYFDTDKDEWTPIISGYHYVLQSGNNDAYYLYLDNSDYLFDVYTGSGDLYNVDFYIPEITYSKYLTTCCDKYITVSSPTITGEGTIEFTPSTSPIATCDDDVEIVATVTPAAGYECTALSFTGGSVSVSPSIASNKPAYPSSQDFTLSFAQNTNATLTTSATFTAKALTGWTWGYRKDADAKNNTGDILAIPDVIEAYIGQYVRFDITGYTPSDVLAAKKGYTYTAGGVAPEYDNTKLSYVGADGSHLTYYTTKGLKAGDATLTFTSVGNGELTKTVTIRVKAMPVVKFKDLVHGESFDDVAGTVGTGGEAGLVTITKATPTHSDVSDPGSDHNTCERQHLHLVGWIRSDWPALVAYLNGTGSAPTKSELENAGTGYWFEPDADINVETYNGKTFYAVWAVEE